MISLLLLSSALAGDLSRAWRGTPYGLATVLAEPPSEHCTQGPEPTIAWTCAQTVGGGARHRPLLVGGGLLLGRGRRVQGVHRVPDPV